MGLNKSFPPFGALAKSDFIGYIIDMKTYAELLKEIEKLKADNHNLRVQNDHLTNQVAWYEAQIRVMNTKKYKTTSESGNIYFEQLPLFDEAEVIQQSIEEAGEESVTVKEHVRKKKTPADFSKLEVRDIHHDIKDRKCPECGASLIELKPLIKEEIEYIPAKHILKRHIIHQYICPECSDDEHTVIRAGENYKKLIDRSKASPSLVASITYMKYAQGLPLYRIEQDFQRKGIPVSRQDMSSWLMICTEKYLKYIFLQMKEDLLKEDILHGDETTVNCLEEKDRDKSYMWIQRTSANSPRQIALYYYNAGREYGFAKKIYEGFRGYLHADAYGAYGDLSDVRVAGCWAHARRKVYEALQSYEADSKYRKSRNKKERDEILAKNLSYANLLKLFNLIEELFSTDKKIVKCSSDFEVIRQKRIEKETELLKSIRSYLEENAEAYPPKSKAGTAIKYIIDCWENLNVYLENGRLELTNNLGERTVKPFVMGRKAWLFANTAKGAQTSAVLYSIVETAKINHLNLEKYIAYILGRLKDMEDPENSILEIRKLLPYSPGINEAI